MIGKQKFLVVPEKFIHIYKLDVSLKYHRPVVAG